MQNFDLENYVATVAKLVLGSDCRLNEGGSQYCVTYDHQTLPLGLTFYRQGYGVRAKKIRCSATCSQGLRKLATQAGYNYPSLKGYTAEKQENQLSLSRSISIDRFSCSPEKVANELKKYVITPGKPAAIKCLEFWTRRAQREITLAAHIANLSKLYALEMHDRTAGNEFRLYQRGQEPTINHIRLYGSDRGEVMLNIFDSEHLTKVLKCLRDGGLL